jgi:hypothetical protein
LKKHGVRQLLKERRSGSADLQVRVQAIGFYPSEPASAGDAQSVKSSFWTPTVHFLDEIPAPFVSELSN